MRSRENGDDWQGPCVLPDSAAGQSRVPRVPYGAEGLDHSGLLHAEPGCGVTGRISVERKGARA